MELLAIQDAGLFETSHRHNHKSLGVFKKNPSQVLLQVGVPDPVLNGVIYGAPITVRATKKAKET